MASVARWCCCGAENPCVSGDPPLEVTVSWTSAPTGNAHWEFTETGKIDLFDETWDNGETKLLCPDRYFFGFSSVYSLASWGIGNQGTSRISFAASGNAVSTRGQLQEDIRTTGNNSAISDAFASMVFGTTRGTATTAFGSITSNLSAKTSISSAELAAAVGPPVDFAPFGGSITTNETITIAWQKSSFFPAGSP